VALPHDLSARDKESLCYSTDCLFINVICVSARFFSVTCCPVSRKWHCAACGTFCLPITLIKLQHNQHTKTVTCGMWEHEAWKHKSLCLCVCVPDSPALLAGRWGRWERREQLLWSLASRAHPDWPVGGVTGVSLVVFTH